MAEGAGRGERRRVVRSGVIGGWGGLGLELRFGAGALVLGAGGVGGEGVAGGFSEAGGGVLGAVAGLAVVSCEY